MDPSGTLMGTTQAKLTIQQPSIHMVAELPEKGTEIKITELSHHYSDANVGLQLQLPSLAGTIITGDSNRPGAPTGSIKIKIKEPAMQRIELAASNSIKTEILTKVATPQKMAEIEQKIRDAANTQISSATQSLGFQVGLRVPLDAESMRAVGALDLKIAGREKRREDRPLEVTEFSRQEARALLAALRKNLADIPPQSDEASRSTRLMLLDSFVRNLTADWDHFCKSAQLNADEQKKVAKLLKKIRSQFDAGDRAEEIRSFDEKPAEKWATISSEFEALAPYLSRLIESSNGLEGHEIQEVDSALLSTLIGAKFKKGLEISVDQANTDLRNNLVALQLGLNRIDHPESFRPVAGCEISPARLAGSSNAGPTLLGSLDVVNQTIRKVMEDDSLNTLFRRNQASFREPPHLEGIPGTSRFKVHAKIDDQKHDIRADVVIEGEIIPSKDKPGSMEIRLTALEDFDQKVGFWDIINPIALVTRSIPGLFGIPAMVAESKFEKAKDHLKVTIPMGSLEQLGVEPATFVFKSSNDFELKLRRRSGK
jgi:hypothetical protein